MLKERFTRRQSSKATQAAVEREKGKRVSEYTAQLHEMNPEQLYAEFCNQIDFHPTLRKDSEDLRKAYANMALAHKGQIRTQSKLPYEVHPAIVALATIKALDEKGIEVPVTAVKAGLKHDMVEDGKRKGITNATIVEQSGKDVAIIVEALTRHEVDGEVIDHAAAARKVREADEKGVEYARIIKTNDRSANIHDQPELHKPPVVEHILFPTKEYRKSTWGKWVRMRVRTRLVFRPIVANGDPFLESIIDHSIQTTKQKVKDRPRKSIRRT